MVYKELLLHDIVLITLALVAIIIIFIGVKRVLCSTRVYLDTWIFWLSKVRVTLFDARSLVKLFDVIH